ATRSGSSRSPRADEAAARVARPPKIPTADPPRIRPNFLRLAATSLICGLPNFARACGRVSVGGHPDKRPDSRLRKWSHFLAHAIGSRRRTGAPRSPRGTRLKATTERAFLGPPARMPDYRRGLSFLPGVRNGSFSLIRTKAAIEVRLSAHVARRMLHRRFTRRPRRQPDREQRRDDCTHPRIP